MRSRARIVSFVIWTTLTAISLLIGPLHAAVYGGADDPDAGLPPPPPGFVYEHEATQTPSAGPPKYPGASSPAVRIERQDCSGCERTLYKIVVSGEIDSRMAEEFISAVRTKVIIMQAPLVVIELNSRGGSVLAAMEIGRAIRHGSLMTAVFGNDHCLSACVLILASGVRRMVGGQVGIHRPHFDEKEFAQLPLQEARQRYVDLEQTVRSYFKEMGISDGLFEAMRRISSDEVVFLSGKELAEYGLDGDDPAYMEWQRAKQIASQGKENYKVGLNFQAVYTACLNETNGNGKYCSSVVTPKFYQRLDGCVSDNGPDSLTDCARRVAAVMGKELR